MTAKGLDQLMSGTLPDLLGHSFTTMGELLKETQSGQIRQYMISIMVSVAVLLLYSIFIAGKVMQGS